MLIEIGYIFVLKGLKNKDFKFVVKSGRLLILFFWEKTKSVFSVFGRYFLKPSVNGVCINNVKFITN